MKRVKFLVFTIISLMPLTAYSQKGITSNYTNNHYPLLEKPYIELPIGAIKPVGWLEHQLSTMVSGLTGNLDKIYGQVMGERNGWLGGDGDVWERGPYWIDGLLPLAYILDNDTLKQKCNLGLSGHWLLRKRMVISARIRTGDRNGDFSVIMHKIGGLKWLY